MDRNPKCLNIAVIGAGGGESYGYECIRVPQILPPAQ